MKIKPYNPDEEGRHEVPRDRLPAWWVIEEDRHVSHVIPLDEVLGIEPPPDTPETEHRQVARNFLRARLHELLSEGLPAEALADHLVFDFKGMHDRRLEADPATRPSEDEHRDWRAFELNHRLATYAFQHLGRRPSHGWSPGLSPMGLAVNCALNIADSRKPRDRSRQDRWWQVVITDLQKILSVIVHREL